MRPTPSLSLLLIPAALLGAAVLFSARPLTAAAEPTSGNLIHNGDFSNGLDRWSYNMDNTAMAIRAVQNGEYVWEISDPGNYKYSLQLQRWGLTIVQGRTYAVYFSARALQGDRTVLANVGYRENPWTDYSGTSTVTLTSAMQRFSFVFTMSHPTDWDAQLAFQVGTNASDVVFDDIALYDLTGGTNPPRPAMPTPSVTYSTLVWTDDFNGSAVDTANWNFETGNDKGLGNQELQHYRKENATVANGILTITAKREAYRGSSYTSARLNTLGKRGFQFGRFEARVWLPYGQGIWPAFWTMGTDYPSIGWPDCGEIDIMEMIGGTPAERRDDTSYGVAHWQNAAGNHMWLGESYSLATGDFRDGWHTFALHWEEKYLFWFVDGVQVHYQDITSPELYDEFHKPHFILLNLAVGGVWPGYPDSVTTFPQKYQIDYVTVYQ